MSNRKFFITDEGNKVKPSAMEFKIINILKNLKINYFREISFKDLNPTNTPLGFYRFDFYLPNVDVIIEYDGKDFHRTKKQLQHDNIKNFYCSKNKIRLVRLTSKDIPNLLQILSAFIK